MKLLKMELTNFRGFKHFVFEPNGKNCTVRGRNGTGKTSLYDALCWLLFSKDSRGQSEFAVKTLDEIGNVAGHGLDHTVEAAFFDQDRGEFCLKRTLTEKWESTRGKVGEKLTGHTMNYKINGKTKTETEYKQFISGLCDEEKFRLLTNPLRFSEDEKRGGIGWKKRRKILAALRPITDEEVIASDPELRPLTKLLGGKTPDEFREECKNRQADIMGNKPGQENYKSIKPRIEELSRMLDVPGDQPALSERVNSLLKQLGTLRIEQVTIRNGGQVAELARQVAEVERQIVEATIREKQIINQQIMDLSDIITGLTREDYQLKTQDENICYKIGIFNGRLSDALGTLEDLETRFQVRRKEAHPRTCDKCGQPMPADSLKEWNRLKSEELLAIREKILQEKITADTLRINQGTLEEDRQRIAVTRASLAEKIAAEKDKVKTLKDIKIQTPPELEGQRIQLADKIDKLNAGNGPAIEELQEKIDRIEDELTAVNQQIAAVKEADKNSARIEELKADEKRLAGEYARLSQHLLLLDEFTRAKVRATEGPINDMFKMAKFKMFEEQINGSLADCCEVTYKGVPFTSDLNSGHRILVGCDIIATLQRHYQFAPVLFIDNAEMFTEPLPEMECQVIRLVADEKCDKLVIV